MTTLKELTITCDPQYIFNLLYLYYNEEDLKSYAKTIDILLDTIPDKSNSDICIVYKNDSYSVFVRDGVKDTPISSVEWEKCLGMNINETCEAIFTRDEILCHCLVGMTKFGFDNKRLKNF